jgi:hypothetical protein
MESGKSLVRAELARRSDLLEQAKTIAAPLINLLKGLKADGYDVALSLNAPESIEGPGSTLVTGEMRCPPFHTVGGGDVFRYEITIKPEYGLLEVSTTDRDWSDQFVSVKKNQVARDVQGLADMIRDAFLRIELSKAPANNLTFSI